MHLPRLFLLPLLLSLVWAAPAEAAVSCSLNDPDRDVRKAFPQSTGYRTEFHSIQQSGGAPLRSRIEQLYGRGLDTYAEVDIMHAFYPVLKGNQLIGYMYGATQKGRYGSLQVIAITTLDAQIESVYYQRLSAPYAKQLREAAFLDQFRGLTLADFQGWQTDPGYKGKVAAIKAPSPESQQDVTETLWGLKKVLLLFDHYYKDGAGAQSWLKES